MPQSSEQSKAELQVFREFVRRSGLPILLADRRPGDVVKTFTVLTTETSEPMRALHHRMPVILPPEAIGPWHSGDDVDLGAATEDRLLMRRVSRAMNNPRNDSPECVVPLSSP